MNTQTKTDHGTGVLPTASMALSPRQQKFIEYYLNVDSRTFGNCYRSALHAGFSDLTSRNITHNKPKWYSEIIGQSQGAQPEHLLLKLTDIMNDQKETTQNKLKAVHMLMKYNGMYKTDLRQTNIQLNKITVQSVLD